MHYTSDKVIFSAACLSFPDPNERVGISLVYQLVVDIIRYAGKGRGIFFFGL